jgi:acyl dehydratase
MNKTSKKYLFNDILIGQREEFTVKITSEIIENFAKFSGDYNPLHMDDNYAKTTKFKKRVSHGILLASFFSRLIGMYLPGENALYLSQTLDFQLPCFVNDEITVVGEVVDKSPATKIITIKTTIYNQSNDCLLSGEAKVIIRE